MKSNLRNRQTYRNYSLAKGPMLVLPHYYNLTLCQITDAHVKLEYSLQCLYNLVLQHYEKHGELNK